LIRTSQLGKDKLAGVFSISPKPRWRSLVRHNSENHRPFFNFVRRAHEIGRSFLTDLASARDGQFGVPTERAVEAIINYQNDRRASNNWPLSALRDDTFSSGTTESITNACPFRADVVRRAGLEGKKRRGEVRNYAEN